MNFLRLSPGALSLAQGGLVVASDRSDQSVAFQNPALLESVAQPRVHASFLILPGGSKGYFLSGVTSRPASPVVTAVGLQYIDHGATPLSDAGGNVLGDFRSREWALQVSASVPYQVRWRGGVSVQLAHSALGSYRATASMMNVGLRYRDTAAGWELGGVLRHLGFFFRRYEGGAQSSLPVELAFGAWRKWKGSPFSLGVVLQRMQRWTLDEEGLFEPALSPLGVDNRRSTFVGQFFNHLILATRIDLHPRWQLLGGYNFLRRRELSWAGGANGLTGFSVGFRGQFDRFDLSFGRAYYQAGQALNQLSLELSLRPASRGWRR